VPKHHEIEAAMETRTEQISEEIPNMETSEVAIALSDGPGQGHVDKEVLDSINELLKTGMFHIFAKLGIVTVKVRALYLNTFDHNYVDLLIADELEDVKISMLWSVKLVAYVGHRRWLW